MDEPGHWTHQEPTATGALMWITCDGVEVERITFGEPTIDRCQRWTRRVMQQHGPHCTLQPKEQAHAHSVT